MAFAERNDLDPAPLIGELSTEFSGKQSQRLHRVAAEIASGLSVNDAITKVPHVLDPVVCCGLKMATQSGRLGYYYAELLKPDPDAEFAGVDATHSENAETSRAMIAAFVSILIVTFIMLFVVPVYDTMFEEFGLSLPAPTMLLISASSMIASMSGFLIMALGLGWILITVGSQRSFFRKLSAMGSQAKSVSSSVGDRYLLALALRLGLPISQAAEMLSREHPNSRARKRFSRSLAATRDDKTPWKSFASFGIISSREGDALSTSDSSQTLAWLLSRSVAKKRRRSAARATLLVRLISFAFTLGFGLVVAFIVISLLMPLAAIIHGLT